MKKPVYVLIFMKTYGTENWMGRELLWTYKMAQLQVRFAFSIQRSVKITMPIEIVLNIATLIRCYI